MWRLVFLMVLCTMAHAKTTFYQVDPGVCDVIETGYSRGWGDGHIRGPLLNELQGFYQTLYPNVTIRIQEVHEDCNHCSGQTMCTLMGCASRWYTRVTVATRDGPVPVSPVDGLRVCPRHLVFAWSPAEMRDRWRYALDWSYCHHDPVACAEDDATPKEWVPVPHETKVEI